MLASLYLCGIHKTCFGMCAALPMITAPLVRILTPVLVMIGILAVTALIFWEIYERVSVFFSVLRGDRRQTSVLVESSCDALRAL